MSNTRKIDSDLDFDPTPSNAEGVGLENSIYLSRFSDEQDRTRQLTWEVLCQEFFAPRISSSKTIVDLGAGDGKFITNIKAKRRIAVDLSEHVNRLSESGVEVYQIAAGEMAKKLEAQVDLVFMSNFLEHLPSKKILLEVLGNCNQVLEDGGQVMILQPNINYVGAKYWDYIDHHIALNEHSLIEALEITGFEIEEMIPRFLPYTARSSVGTIAQKFDTKKLVSTYLKFPFLWKIFGGQTFVSARKLSNV